MSKILKALILKEESNELYILIFGEDDNIKRKIRHKRNDGDNLIIKTSDDDVIIIKEYAVIFNNKTFVSPITLRSLITDISKTSISDNGITGNAYSNANRVKSIDGEFYVSPIFDYLEIKINNVLICGTYTIDDTQLKIFGIDGMTYHMLIGYDTDKYIEYLCNKYYIDYKHLEDKYRYKSISMFKNHLSLNGEIIRPTHYERKNYIYLGNKEINIFMHSDITVVENGGIYVINTGFEDINFEKPILYHEYLLDSIANQTISHIIDGDKLAILINDKIIFISDIENNHAICHMDDIPIVFEIIDNYVMVNGFKVSKTHGTDIDMKELDINELSNITSI